MTVNKTDELELDYGEKLVLREPLESQDGSLLLSKGTILNYELVSRLKKHDVNFINKLEIMSSEAGKAPIDGVTLVSGDSFRTSVLAVKKVFEHALESEHSVIKNVIPKNHLTLVESVVSNIMLKLMASEDLLYTVSELIISDDYTYHHSVNVCILSILTARALGYSESEIKDIAMGSLLHDIGKIKVKDGLVQKPTALDPDEQEEMKRHSEYGYEMIKDMPELPYSVKQIVRFHHEKLDGSGYPYKLTNMEIPQYVRIVTVCDMYDAMTANRIYRKPMPAYLALEVLMRDCVYKLDATVYRAMTGTVCIYAIGQGVMLSDGRVGIVSGYRHHSPSRPKVKLIEYSLKTGELDIEEINLEENNTLFIIDSWDVSGFKSFLNKKINRERFDVKNVDDGTMIG